MWLLTLQWEQGGEGVYESGRPFHVCVCSIVFEGFVLRRLRKAQGLFEGKLACRHTDFEVLGGPVGS